MRCAGIAGLLRLIATGGGLDLLAGVGCVATVHHTAGSAGTFGFGSVAGEGALGVIVAIPARSACWCGGGEGESSGART